MILMKQIMLMYIFSLILGSKREIDHWSILVLVHSDGVGGIAAQV